jgi:hypothetical protein
MPPFSGIQVSHDFAIESVNLPVAREADQLHRALLTRFKPDGGSGGDVETEPASALPVETQGIVNLVKMEMGADLDGPVAGVADRKGDGLAAGIKFKVTLFGQNFTRDHVASVLRNGMVDGNEFGAVRKGCLDLDFGDHFGNTFH